MSEAITLTAQHRSEIGKAESRRLRRAALVPAVVYGGDSAPAHLKLPENDVLRVFKFESAYSQMLKLVVDGKEETVVTKDVTMHPYKPLVMHIDFLRVKSDTPITMRVPLHFQGEADSVGVKAGGVAAHLMTDIEITCLPAHLPEAIDVDVSAIEVGQTVQLSQVVLPAKVSLAQAIDAEHDQAIYSVHVPHVEEEEPAEAAAEESGDEAASDSAEEASE